MTRRRLPRRQDGFTLIEAVVALAVLSVGLLSLAQTFYIGMRHMATSSANLLAREKAREAVESVHTARDMRDVSWADINNVSHGGVFLDGPQPLYAAGADGLVNTADDSSAGLEAIRDPGPNGKLGDSDDIVTELRGYTREIRIAELSPVNADLRQLTVIITYQVGSLTQSYTLRTYIAAFS